MRIDKKFVTPDFHEITIFRTACSQKKKIWPFEKFLFLYFKGAYIISVF